MSVFNKKQTKQFNQLTDQLTIINPWLFANWTA